MNKDSQNQYGFGFDKYLFHDILNKIKTYLAFMPEIQNKIAKQVCNRCGLVSSKTSLVSGEDIVHNNSIFYVKN